jgi:hypothetical protein
LPLHAYAASAPRYSTINLHASFKRVKQIIAQRSGGLGHVYDLYSKPSSTPAQMEHCLVMIRSQIGHALQLGGVERQGPAKIRQA